MGCGGSSRRKRVTFASSSDVSDYESEDRVSRMYSEEDSFDRSKGQGHQGSFESQGHQSRESTMSLGQKIQLKAVRNVPASSATSTGVTTYPITGSMWEKHARMIKLAGKSVMAFKHAKIDSKDAQARVPKTDRKRNAEKPDMTYELWGSQDYDDMNSETQTSSVLTPTGVVLSPEVAYQTRKGYGNNRHQKNMNRFEKIKSRPKKRGLVERGTTSSIGNNPAIAQTRQNNTVFISHQSSPSDSHSGRSGYRLIEMNSPRDFRAGEVPDRDPVFMTELDHEDSDLSLGKPRQSLETEPEAMDLPLGNPRQSPETSSVRNRGDIHPVGYEDRSLSKTTPRGQNGGYAVTATHEGESGATDRQAKALRRTLAIGINPPDTDFFLNNPQGGRHSQRNALNGKQGSPNSRYNQQVAAGYTNSYQGLSHGLSPRSQRSRADTSSRNQATKLNTVIAPIK